MRGLWASPAPLHATSPIVALALVHARVPCALTMAADPSYEALEAQLTDYLRQKPGASLKYTDLQKDGRLDLVQGIMKQGGYLAVSQRLGLDVKLPSLDGSDKVDPYAAGAVDAAGDQPAITLSRSKLEEKLSAPVKLGGNQSGGSSSPTTPTATSSADTYYAGPVAPAPRPAGAREVTPQSDSGGYGLGWVLRFDALQRVCLVAACWVGAAGFGHASEAALDSQAAEAAQQLFALVALANVAMALGAAVLAARRGTEAPAVAVFTKTLLTGVGGLREAALLSPREDAMGSRGA